jgi:hypothetical protein
MRTRQNRRIHKNGIDIVGAGFMPASVGAHDCAHRKQ